MPDLLPGAVVAVIPLKAIRASKTRMAPDLGPDDRALLLHRSFQRVVSACDAAGLAGLVVVTGDAEAADWARAAGAQVVDEPPRAGLNGAIALVDAHLGTVPSLVVPADLPLVAGEDLVAVTADATAAPCVVIAPTADGGTGALLRRPGAVIAPAYGRGSSARHARAALAADATVVWCRRPGLALDLDRPDDIARAGGWDAVTADLRAGPGGQASVPARGAQYPAG